MLLSQPLYCNFDTICEMSQSLSQFMTFNGNFKVKNHEDDPILSPEAINITLKK